MKHQLFLVVCSSLVILGQARPSGGMDVTLLADESVTVSTTEPSFYCVHDNGFQRHPTDQHKFIECVGGHPFEFVCPANLYWNQHKQECDYTTGPDDADDLVKSVLAILTSNQDEAVKR